MSKSFAKDKGARGERASIALLQPVVNACYARAGMEPPTLARNSLQSRFGGFDIVGLDWLALEIKNQEKTNVPAWWKQTTQQASSTLNRVVGSQLPEPVLMYKANRVAWRVVMFGYLPCVNKRIKTPVDIDIKAFLVWFEHRLNQELATAVKVG